MKQPPLKRLAFWFHFGISILTSGISFGMAFFIAGQGTQSSFPWWIYILFALYILFIFTLDDVLFEKKERAQEKENSAQLKSDMTSSN